MIKKYYIFFIIFSFPFFIGYIYFYLSICVRRSLNSQSDRGSGVEYLDEVFLPRCCVSSAEYGLHVLHPL